MMFRAAVCWLLYENGTGSLYIECRLTSGPITLQKQEAKLSLG